jgi:CHAT domain-containing protein
MEMGESDKAILDLYQGLRVNYYGELDPDHFEKTDIKKIIDKNQFIETLVALIRFNDLNFSADERSNLLSKNLVLYQLIADISIKLRETYRLERSKLQALQKWDFLYLEAFKTAVELYQKTGEERYFNSAFRFAGLKKASALTDAILMAQAMENSGIPDSVIHLEKTLHSSLEGYRQKLLEMDYSSGEPDQAASIENEINRLNISINDLYLNIEKNYPEYDNLRTSYPLHMPDEIRNLLGSGTLLLDFIVSDSSIYSIVMGKNGKWIEKTSVPVDFENRVNDLLRSVKKFRPEDFIAISKEVYSAVLTPLEKHFTGIGKIIIIPDNYLLLLPFDILIKNEGNLDSTDLVSQNYFIRRFETVTHYSTDLWIRSYQDHTSNQTDSQISGFIGFAPVFDHSEINHQIVLTDRIPAEMDSSFTHREVVNRMSLMELPFSELEVDSLVSLFNQFGIEARGMLRSQATEEMFRASSGKYRYIHIATHGLINPEKPELSGLVFWKDTSDHEDPAPRLLISEKENDGVVYTKEVYDLNINADLVTLSACETGAGLMAKGEGLLSFVRGFTYAGVPNMLISLWKVNDKTTADFMIDFYKAVLSGDSYPAALRKAKLEAISNRDTSFPALWGNFVLIGY